MDTTINWNYLLERLRNQLNCIGENVTTPLAFNLRMLAAISDAEHILQMMETLYRKWSTELPYIEDEGMEVDWAAVSSMYQEAFSEYINTENKVTYPATYIPLPPPNDVKGWRQWKQEEKYRREEGEDKDLNSPDYSHYLQPTIKENVWGFVGNELSAQNEKRVALKQTLRHYSSNDCKELQEALRRIYQKIYKRAMAIDKLLQRPHRVFEERTTLDRLMKEFFERLIKKFSYHTGEGIACGIEREYEDWHDMHIASFSEKLFKGKVEECWQQLVESHFLDDLMLTHENKEYEPARTREITDEFLLCKNAPVEKREEQEAIAIGRYIYQHQLESAEWKKRTKAFLRYWIFRKRINEELEQQNNNQLKLDEKNQKIRRCILKLLEEKNKDGKLLMENKSYWIAIYRILVDDYGWEKSLTHFCNKMEEWGVANSTPACSYESLKKANPFFSVKSFESWKEEKYEGNKATFYKTHAVAKRFKDILEAEKG